MSHLASTPTASLWVRNAPLVLLILGIAAQTFSGFGQTNLSEPVPADVPVDKVWLRETLQALLATLAVFLLMVLGARFIHSTNNNGEEVFLAEGKGMGARLWNVARGLGPDFWVLAAIVGVLAAMRFYPVWLLSLLVLYATAKLVLLILRERVLVRNFAQEKEVRDEAEEAERSEIDEFAERLGRRRSHSPKKEKVASSGTPLRVEVRARPTLQSEKFLRSCINENCLFRALPAKRREPLAAELIRKLHLRWKEFELRDDAVYLNRQDGSGALDQVCILLVQYLPGSSRTLRINAGFLQWALGNMLTRHDLVYETEDGYHAPDATERAEIDLLPESRRPRLLPVKDIANPWHAMIGHTSPR